MDLEWCVLAVVFFICGLFAQRAIRRWLADKGRASGRPDGEA